MLLLLYFSSTLSSFLFYIYLMPATGQNCNFKYMILSINILLAPTPPLSHWKISTLCVRLYTFMCLLNGHKHKIIYFFMYVESHTKQQHNTTFSFSFFFFLYNIFFSSWGHSIIYTGVHVCLLLVDEQRFNIFKIPSPTLTITIVSICKVEIPDKKKKEKYKLFYKCIM